MNRVFPLVSLVLVIISCSAEHQSEHSAATLVKEVAQKTTFGDTLALDLQASKVLWKGTKMRGLGKHEGEINLKAGFLLTQMGQLSGGQFVADMTSINVTDIPEDEPVPHRRLNNHLKIAEFFDVENYPHAQFTITQIQWLSPDSIQVTGNLTIKDITNVITFNARPEKNTFSTRFPIDRFRWNIAYEGSWADRTLVDREIELSILLKGN